MGRPIAAAAKTFAVIPEIDDAVRVQYYPTRSGLGPAA
jgi:hypothetical protein